jgi:hypothetical protein
MQCLSRGNMQCFSMECRLCRERFLIFMSNICRLDQQELCPPHLLAF